VHEFPGDVVCGLAYSRWGAGAEWVGWGELGGVAGCVPGVTCYQGEDQPAVAAFEGLCELRG